MVQGSAGQLASVGALTFLLLPVTLPVSLHSYWHPNETLPARVWAVLSKASGFWGQSQFHLLPYRSARPCMGSSWCHRGRRWHPTALDGLQPTLGTLDTAGWEGLTHSRAACSACNPCPPLTGPSSWEFLGHDNVIQ